MMAICMSEKVMYVRICGVCMYGWMDGYHASGVHKILNDTCNPLTGGGGPQARGESEIRKDM